MELVPAEGFFWNIGKDERITQRLNSVLFKPEVREANNKISITLTAQLDNATVVKRFSFYKNEYKIELQTEGLPYGIYLGPQVAPTDRKTRYSFVGPLVYNGKKVLEVKLKKKPETTFDNPKWVALQSLYFTVTLIPEKPTKVRIAKAGKSQYYVYLTPQKDLLVSWGFAGPKKFELLKSYGMKLEENIRFGIFGVISKPLLYLMNWLYKIIPNYGVAIIIITILIKNPLPPPYCKGIQIHE